MTLANRIVMSPMCQYSASQGGVADWHMIHLGQLALSRAGMLDIEASVVEPAGRITPADLGLWDMCGTARRCDPRCIRCVPALNSTRVCVYDAEFHS
ncbi:hypothetical protein KQH49_00470 [Mycetohabitans sp. B5]|uniref:NADH:flavin oxidoreductase/NADH oxidase family protein n=1 Tax=Mycetohabitans endofungorum TaxID=417203 RepID=A0A2P5K7E1_9BURK|nr:hypothetical protein [Mycetohabitans sp. B5]PPB81989.1 NADH:flavin oxidoreductase/NADH oxidase family protein [Mycetohabitans endofungorum]